MTKEIKFEDQIKELEKLIDDLESGDIDVDESINKYTKAMTLVKECDKKLKNIEKQVNKIVTADGLKDFDIEKS